MKQVFVTATVAPTASGDLSPPFPPRVGISETEQSEVGREPIGPLHALENAAEKDRDGKRSLQLGAASGISFSNRVRETCNDVYLFFFLDSPGLVTYILLVEK